jgi:hypothetical protein
MSDLYNRDPSGVIRIRPEAYDIADPSASVFQLNVTDITRANLIDMEKLDMYSQKMTGLSDTVMGMLDPGGRKTAQEIRTSSSFATNRLKVHAEFLSANFFSPMSSMLLANSQQYFKGELDLKFNEDFGVKNRGIFMNIRPELIAGQFDYSPVDGTIPIDRQTQGTIMQNLFMSIAGNQQMAQSYNLMEMFEFIAKLLGVGSLPSFRIQTMPQDQFNQQTQAGNLVPTQQGMM